VLCLAWTSDAKTIFSGGADGVLRAWDPAARSERWAHALGPTWIEHLRVAAGSKLVAAAAGRRVVFFSLEGAFVSQTAPLDSTVTSLLFHPKTKRFVASVYGGVRWLAPKHEAPLRCFAWKDSLLGLAQSVDGRWLAAPCQDTSVHIWDAVTGDDMAMTGFPGKVKGVAWSEIGPTLATACAQQITLWSFAGKGPNGTTGRPFRGHAGRVLDLATTRTGQWLLSCSEAGELVAWRLGDGEALLLEDVAVGLERLTVAPDGSCVAAITEGGGVIVVDLQILP
jgi:WD40 repeat protein